MFQNCNVACVFFQSKIQRIIKEGHFCTHRKMSVLTLDQMLRLTDAFCRRLTFTRGRVILKEFLRFDGFLNLRTYCSLVAWIVESR